MSDYYNVDVIGIPSATQSKSDPAQFMTYKGVLQTNLCGHLSVAYCVGEPVIDTLLQRIETEKPKLFASLFKSGKGRTTSIYDLTEMLLMYSKLMSSTSFAKTKMNPETLSKMLDTYRAIVGVQIDNSGYLVGKGIPHWVVLDRITAIDANHAICDIYNPYTNAMEPYSWRELMTSTGAYKQGIFVSR